MNSKNITPLQTNCLKHYFLNYLKKHITSIDVCSKYSEQQPVPTQ